MPGLVQPVTTEHDLLLGYLAQQRRGVTNTTHGLTTEQATARPTVSALSLAGLVKHTAMVEQTWTTFIVEGDSSIFMPAGEYGDGFALADGETLEDALTLSADTAAHTEKLIRDLPDLGVPLTPTKGDVRWIPEGLVWTPRWILLHLIEEVARHAGHADIIREAIDGATVWELMAAVEGWPAQAWD